MLTLSHVSCIVGSDDDWHERQDNSNDQQSQDQDHDHESEHDVHLDEDRDDRELMYSQQQMVRILTLPYLKLK